MGWLWFVAAALAAGLACRSWRRLLAHLVSGRSRMVRVVVRRDGALRLGPCRLRLYGIAPLDDVMAAALLRQAVAGRPVRLRVLAVDVDGTLAVVLRCAGTNLAIALLRDGWARTRGTGARRYRQAQATAQRERRGGWRLFEPPSHGVEGAASMPPALVFPWWQG